MVSHCAAVATQTPWAVILTCHLAQIFTVRFKSRHHFIVKFCHILRSFLMLVPGVIGALVTSPRLDGFLWLPFGPLYPVNPGVLFVWCVRDGVSFSGPAPLRR